MNDKNRVEVYDEASDVVVYDVEKHEIVTASNIFSKDAFETFPTFSPDGKTLYFCTAEARPIPQEYSEVKYNLCSVSFDPATRAFESYHSWSSNSRWFVFSSRRIDGLYTRPYIAYVGEDGKVGKPFLLPQKDTDFYHSFMKSFNIPEFITGKVKVQGRVLAIKAKSDKGKDVRFAR